MTTTLKGVPPWCAHPFTFEDLNKVVTIYNLHWSGALFLSNTNCNGPHTINTVNVGSTRDLISRKNVNNDNWLHGSFCNLCTLAVWLALHISVRYKVLTSPKKDETAVHSCDPALSVLVMLVSRNVFHVVSALQSIVALFLFAEKNAWSQASPYTILKFTEHCQTLSPCFLKETHP